MVKLEPLKVLILLFVFLFIGGFVLAEEVSVTAEVDPNPVGLNDQLTLTLRVNGPAGGAEAPQMPKIEGLKLEAGPSVARSFQWINGQATSSQSFVYVFEPQKEGTLRIPPLPLKIGGKVYETKELYVRVVKDAGTGQRSAPRRRSPFSIFDDMGLEEDSPFRDRTPRREDLITTAEVDKKNAYVGEQIVLSYKVLAQIPVVQVELKESSPLTGFWSEEVTLPKTPESRNRVLNGKRYVEYVVKKQILFPTKSGTIEIPPSTFNLLVRTSGSPFSFPNQDVAVRKTAPLSIKVSPLPETGRPPAFGGAVGEFRLESSVDKSRAVTGDAINLRVRLSGAGNLRTITEFPLPDLPGFKIYSSKSRDEVSVRNDLLQGSKAWEYVIVPLAPGVESIPELRFTYFSPAEHRYLEKQAPPIQVAVAPGSGQPTESSFGVAVSPQSVVKRGSDISYLKIPAAPLRDHSRFLYQSQWLFGIILLPLLFNVGLLVHTRQQTRLQEDLKGFRSRRAGKITEKRLAQARKCLKANQLGQFHGILLDSVTGYLSDKFNLPQIEITSQQVRRYLNEQHWEEPLIEDLVKVLEDCNFARYAPVSLDRPGLEALFEKARDVVVRIERRS
ncbi:MAG TPA: BatD family protein [Terriglobia bacterium]|nr:BatD family protein [Terriglobia bacterium]